MNLFSVFHKKFFFANYITFYLVLLIACKLNSEVLDISRFCVDFDNSMDKCGLYYWCMLYSYLDFYKSTFPMLPVDLYNFLKNLYERNCLKAVVRADKPFVPKIIHQIWLGGTFPESLRKWQKTWIAKHPDWEYRLWTDSDVATLNLYNRQLYDRTSRLASKADILSYEILYKFGGVYIDTDFECLQPLDVLHHRYEFYVGVQPLDITCLCLGHGIIGTIPQHPIIKLCMDIQRSATIKNVINESETFGPIVLTKAFWNVVKFCDNGLIVALPATFFYPLGCTQKFFKRDAKKLLIKPESFAIHHWLDGWNCKDEWCDQKDIVNE